MRRIVEGGKSCKDLRATASTGSLLANDVDLLLQLEDHYKCNIVRQDLALNFHSSLNILNLFKLFKKVKILK